MTEREKPSVPVARRYDGQVSGFMADSDRDKKRVKVCYPARTHPLSFQSQYDNLPTSEKNLSAHSAVSETPAEEERTNLMIYETRIPVDGLCYRGNGRRTCDPSRWKLQMNKL